MGLIQQIHQHVERMEKLIFLISNVRDSRISWDGRIATGIEGANTRYLLHGHESPQRSLHCI